MYLIFSVIPIINDTQHHSIHTSHVEKLLFSLYKRGKVFATEPTILLGGLFMEEMIDFLDRAPRTIKSGEWKKFQRHLPPPLCDLKHVGDLRQACES